MPAAASARANNTADGQKDRQVCRLSHCPGSMFKMLVGRAMRMRRTGYMLCLLAALGACHRADVIRADFPRSFREQSRKLGVRHRQEFEPLPLAGSWTAETDANAFVWQVRAIPFDEGFAFLTNDLGYPRVFVKTNMDGFPQAVWGASSVGGAVQCIGAKDGFVIICMRGLKPSSKGKGSVSPRP